MPEQSEVIQDSSEWRDTKQGCSYKEIVMTQVKVCVRNFSQEMKAGYWVLSYPNPNMSPERTKYCEDTRKTLIGSVKALHDILLPKFDDTMKKASTEIDRLDEELYKNTKADEEELSDKALERYWHKKVNIYRNLFQDLVKFLERMSWLDMEATEE